MKSLMRRIEKLEQDRLPPPETAFSRRLRARLEAGRRRVAAARGETVSMAVTPLEAIPYDGVLSLAARLNRGRERALRQSRGRSEPVTEIAGPQVGQRGPGDSA